MGHMGQYGPIWEYKTYNPNFGFINPPPHTWNDKQKMDFRCAFQRCPAMASAPLQATVVEHKRNFGLRSSLMTCNGGERNISSFTALASIKFSTDVARLAKCQKSISSRRRVLLF